MKCKYAKRLLAVAVTAAMLATSFEGSTYVNAETAQTQEADVTTTETEAETAAESETAAGEEAVEPETASEAGAVNPADVEVEADGSQGQEAGAEVTDDQETAAETDSANEAAALSEQYDTTAPVIESVALDKQGQTIGEDGSFKVLIKAYDADSGIDNVSLTIGWEGTANAYSFNAIYNKETGYYETDIEVGHTSVHGKTYLKELSVTDQAGNVTRAKVADINNDQQYCATEDNAINWVMVQRDDIEKPVIQSVEIEEAGKTLKAGDTVHIKVQASDNGTLSEYGFIDLRVNNIFTNTREYQGISLQWDENEKCYKGSLDITDDILPGTWSITEINIEDSCMNKADFDAASYKDRTFTVQNDGYDLEAPKLKSFQMDKIGATLTTGDQVKFTVEATDNKEVDTVRITLESVSDATASINNTAYCDLQKVEGTTDKYEGIYTIKNTDYPGEWNVKSIWIVDVSGNYSTETTRNALDGTNDYRMLSYDYYYNVSQNGTFVQKSYTVTCAYMNADKKWETKQVSVPRRTTAEDLKKLFTPDVSLKEANFTGWNLRGPVLNDYTHVQAVYDKAIVSKVIYSRTLDENGIFRELYNDTFFASQGDRIDLPTSMPGIKNIKWYTDTELEIKDNACILTGNKNEYWFEAEADADGTTPSIDNNKKPENSNPADNNSQNEGTKLSSEKIQENVTKVNTAKAGETISVSMNDATVAPKEILEAAKGKDINIVLEMNGYKWTINGKNIKADNLKDINLAVNTNANAIPNNVVSSLAGSNPVKQISLAYSGDFGFQASLSYNIGNEYAGKFGNLYYYDSTGRMIFQNAGSIDANGNVSLTFSHASEYAVVITDTPQNEGNQNNDQSGNTLVSNKQAGGLQTANAAKAPKTGDNNAAALYLVLCAMGVAAAAVAVRKKRA